MKKNLFRLSLVIGVLVLTRFNAFAQCTVEAGEDFSICTDFWGIDTTHIGSNLQVVGGTLPYTYTWETQASIGSNFIYASDYLNDTSSANPKIFTKGPDILDFRITITDANQIQCFDSVRVIFSSWILQMTWYDVYINLGDSMSFFDQGLFDGTRPPFQYSWNPPDYVSNPNSLFSYASPVSDTEYSVEITDAVGCKFQTPPLYYVWVNSLGQIEKRENKDILLYPNPSNGIINIVSEKSSLDDVTIFDLKGNILLSEKWINKTKSTVDLSNFSSGRYILKVHSDGSNKVFPILIER
jgi:hypothetical protein